MTTRRSKLYGGWALASALACAACGGSSRTPGSDPLSPTSAAGADAADDLDGASGAGATANLDPSGGATTEPAGRAGAANEVTPSAGAQGYVSIIDSGTRACTDSDTCFGLACYAPLAFQPSVCLAPCQRDEDCHPSEACVRSVKLEPSCYHRCDSPTDCYGGFDCVDFSGAGLAICFPASWAQRLIDLDD